MLRCFISAVSAVHRDRPIDRDGDNGGQNWQDLEIVNASVIKTGRETTCKTRAQDGRQENTRRSSLKSLAWKVPAHTFRCQQGARRDATAADLAFLALLRTNRRGLDHWQLAQQHLGLLLYNPPPLRARVALNTRSSRNLTVILALDRELPVHQT